MNVDASTIKQLLQLQLLNKMSLITSGKDNAGTSAAGEDDFAGILQSMLGQGGGMAATSAGSDPFAALAALTSSPMPLGGGAGLPLSLSGVLTSAHQPSTAAGSAALKPAMPRSRGGYMADPAVGKPSGYDPLIVQASTRYGVDSSLVKAVIDQESSFNPYAVSTAGAKGLMQLMDDTGEGYGVTDPFDPQQNVHAGTQFLASLLHKYNGHEGVALAAYNAGPGRIDRLGIRTDADLAAKLERLPQETQHYVARVLGLKDQYAAASKTS